MMSTATPAARRPASASRIPRRRAGAMPPSASTGRRSPLDLHRAAQVARGEGGAAGPVRLVVEGLHAAPAGVAMALQRGEDRSEAVLALAGGAAVAVVEVDMGNL